MTDDDRRGRPDDRQRLAVARFLLSPEMADLPVASRNRALAAVLGEEEVPSHGELLEWLSRCGLGESLVVLKVRERECRDAARAHDLRMAGKPIPEELARALRHLPLDVPLGWEADGGPDPDVGRPIVLLGDRAFLDRWPDRVPVARTLVDEALAAASLRLAEGETPEALEDPAALAEPLLRDPRLPGPLRDRLLQVRQAWAEAALAQRKAVAEGLEAGRLPPRGGPSAGVAYAAVAERLGTSNDPEERRRLLDWVLSSPSRASVPTILAAGAQPWALPRVLAVLSLRFGPQSGAGWPGWRRWLAAQARPPEQERLLRLGIAPGLLLLLIAEQPGSVAEPLRELLRLWCRALAEPPLAVHFLERWRGRLPADEVAELSGRPRAEAAAAPVPETEVPRPEAEPTPEPEPEPQPEPGPEPPPAVVEPPRIPVTPPPPALALSPEPEEVLPPPDRWRGFVTENANLLAGVAMLLVGASLLAYFTWDRHWLFRYTLLPGLFAAFTAGLAAVASWLERNDASEKGTAAMLRGAAIALLPANCMSVSLLASDPAVNHKLVAVPAMASVYLVLILLGLRRWCGAVHPGLREVLAPGLALLNALVLVPPLARGVAPLDTAAVLAVLTVGFYVGFLVVAELSRRFLTRVLTPEVAATPHVTWFAGGIVAVTYLQVFAWTHAFERQWPGIAVYGPLVLLAGGLVFHVERQFRLVLGPKDETGEESFVGFALILAGLLMTFSSPVLRIAAFALAGTLWLYQAGFRRNPIHDYIGLLLVALGGASVALLPGFPRTELPVLGLALCLVFPGIGWLAPRVSLPRLRPAAGELEQGLLVLTAITAALVQWHFRSEPLRTAAVLAVVAVLHFARAVRHQSARDGFVGAMVAALVLPYLGFADMRGQKLVGNILVSGLGCLSLLWLAGLRLFRFPVLRELRSAVLFVYGGFALAAMVARVAFERAVVPSASWSQALPEYVGPFLMAAVLVYTTLVSRSLLPVVSGLLIVVVLFPEMKADFQALLPAVAWGTGFGSAWVALAFLLLAFFLRDLPSLEELGEGDRFFGGVPFALRRYDHTLLTTPLLGAVLFLILRVDVYSLVRNWTAAPPKTAIALVLSAVTWTLLGVWVRDRDRDTGRAAVFTAFVPLWLGLWLAQRGRADPWALEWPLLAAGIVLQAAEAGYRAFVVPRHPWAEELLARPTRATLRASSLVIAMGLVGVLAAGHDPAPLRLLEVFVLAQVARAALREESHWEGALAVGASFVVVLAETAPGVGDLVSRLSWERSLWPVLAFGAVWQACVPALERSRSWWGRLSPVLDPARTGAAALTLGAAVVALGTTVLEPRFAPAQLAVVVVSLLLLGRWALAGPATLLAAAISYVLVLQGPLAHAATPQARLELLFDPTRLSLFSLVLALVAVVTRFGPPAARAWLKSPVAVSALDVPAARSQLVSAAALATAATLRHSMEPSLRALPEQAAAPYIAAAALGVIAAALASPVAGWMAAIALTLGNVHGVRLLWGRPLRLHGLSDVHLAALGVAATLAQGSLARLATPSGRARDFLKGVTLAAAALVLTLLSGNFVGDPNLQGITWQRLVFSGTLALAAGLCFRRAATRPEPDEAPHVAVAYAVYHFGLAMALWCLVLLVPALRQPVFALPGLALPALYFFVAAERFFRRQDPRFVQYSRSATVLILAVLGLYVARPVFQMAFFPEALVQTDHYHYNAPLVVLLGLLLLRLGGFERRFLVAYAGGAAVLVGTYFGLTGWRGLSPFETRFPAAWAAAALAHGFTWLGRWDGPGRERLQRLGRIDDPAWDRLTLAWHLTAFVGAVDLALLAVVHPDAARFGMAAMLGAAVSVLLSGPWRHGALAAVTGTLLAIGVVEAVGAPCWLSEIGILAVALLVGRMAPAPFVLVGWLAVYVMAQHPQLLTVASGLERWAVVTSPWRLAALGLGLSLTQEAARRRGAASRSWALWLGIPAIALATMAAAISTLDGRWHAEPAQLFTAYLAAATHALVSLVPAAGGLAWSAAVLLALANHQAIDYYVGDVLRAHGLSEGHLLAMAVVAMLLLVVPIRRWARTDDGARRLLAVRVAGAAAILGLLVGAYAAHPGVPGFGRWPAISSGLLAAVAAEALRHLARRALSARERRGATVLYHAAVVVTIESAAMTIPFLRTPELGLLTLALPAFYFWARNETSAAGDPFRVRYQESATALSLAVLVVYLSRELFRAVLFPEALPPLRHYHTHAAVVIALGLVLLRLRARGAPYAAAVAGGMAVMVGSYFGATSWPGLSPFDHPLAGAWAGVVLVHLFTLATAPSSAVTAVLRGFGGLGEEEWSMLRETVGKAALFGAHLLVFSAIVHPGVDTHAVAPLLVGTASLLAHHGVLRGSGLYLDLAAVELLVAVHADLFVPSTLSLDDAVWVVLGIRAVLLGASTRVPPTGRARTRHWGTVTACLAVLHVCRCPWSTSGLWAAAILAVLTALVPRERRAAVTFGDRLVVVLLLAMPTWLVAFASGRWEAVGIRAGLESGPLLRTLLTVFVTAVAARTVSVWGGRPLADGAVVRAAHQVRQFLEDSGQRLHGVLLLGVSLGAGALLVGRYGETYTNPELALFLVVLAGLALEWYRRGRSRGAWRDCLVAEAALAAALGLLRRQLLLRTELWTYEYDLWLSLSVSAVLTGLKQRVDRPGGAAEIRRPVTLSILVMPVLAIGWALTHGLGSDMVLLVVGLNSVLFAFLGHERRDSPYNLVAVSGFVAFVLIVFWSKLELRVLHAYTVPVGVGVLLLLQLFQKDVGEAAATRVRFATLAVMLGSAAYHALLDPRYPLAFNLALLLLCLGSVAVGSWLRVRLYVGLGLSVLLLDLVSLGVKALRGMESQTRMTWVGAAVFLLGALIVAAAVYRKARREEIEARLSRWRERMKDWR